MPFSGGECGVSVFAEAFREGFGALQIHFDSKIGLSAHHHGAAGLADCAVHGTHAVVSPEAEAFGDKAVDVRCVDVWISIGANGVCALVIGEDEEDVRAFGTCGKRGQCQD